MLVLCTGLRQIFVLSFKDSDRTGSSHFDTESYPLSEEKTLNTHPVSLCVRGTGTERVLHM